MKPSFVSLMKKDHLSSHTTITTKYSLPCFARTQSGVISIFENQWMSTSSKYTLLYSKNIGSMCTIHYSLINAYSQRACIHSIIPLYNTPPPLKN